MIKRADIVGLIGVNFSKNFQVKEMQQSVALGMTNVKQSIPKLYVSLGEFLPKLEILAKNEELITKSIQKIQSLKEKIKQGESLFKQAVKIYETQDQKITSIIGITPGSNPPYPTAPIETGSLISAVNSAETTLVKLQSQLDDELVKIVKFSTNFKEEVEKIGEDIYNTLIEFDPIEFDPEFQQFIYT